MCRGQRGRRGGVQVTAAAILDSTILVGSLVEDLLTTWHVTVEEAIAIKAITEAWGEEPNNRMTGDERRREIATRIHSYLRTRRTAVSILTAALS